MTPPTPTPDRNPPSMTVPEATRLLKSIVISIPDMQAASEEEVNDLIAASDAIDVIYCAGQDELERRDATRPNP